MFPAHKNSYLQCVTSIDPRIINRSVDLACEKPTVSCFDKFHPFNRLTSQHPNIPIPNCDITRRPLAFDRWALPKLRRELHDKDIIVSKQAIESICDIVSDPERKYEAIKLRIPDRFGDLLAERDEPEVLERVCLALKTISEVMEGKLAVVKRTKILETLRKLLSHESDEVRLHVVNLIETLSSFWVAADYLVDAGFVQELSKNIMTSSSADISFIGMLKIMENLMHCDGKDIAIENNYYTIVVEKLETETIDDVIVYLLKNITLLTQTDKGKELGLAHKVLKLLHKQLLNENPEVYTAAASAIMALSVKSEAILKTIQLPNLTARLIQLIKNHHEPSAQIFCLQILINLCGYKYMKTKVIKDHLKELEELYVNHNEHVARLKNVLLTEALLF